MRRSQKIFLVLFAAIMLWHGIPVYAAETASGNTGFVSNAIWYSEPALSEGDAVTIYTAIWNGRKERLSGTVAFYDGNIILGQKTFSAPGYNVVTDEIKWNVTAGDHSIYAAIVSPTITASGKTEPIFLGDPKTKEDSFTIKKTLVAVPTPNPANPESSTSDTPIPNAIPAAVSVPVSHVAGAVETWRTDTGATFAEKKDATQKEIDTDAKKPVAHATVSDDGTVSVAPASNPLKTPFAYAKLFFFTASAFVFQNKILFYALCGLILFFVIRMIWQRFFRRY